VDLQRRLVEIANDCIDSDRTFLIDAEVKGNHNNQKLQVFIDGDHGVDVDECSKISRKISYILEESDLIEGKYIIEVSSPGASKPLKLARQYPKHVGRELEINKSDKSKVTGELRKVSNDKITISPSSSRLPGEMEISFSEIDSAKVLIRF